VRTAPELGRDLVLVGGGHSHALALRMLAMNPVEGLRITLVSPASHTPYSGMLPGLVAGHYRFEDAHIDLARLCEWAGVRFITAEACGLQPGARRVELLGRPALDYDVVSLDIGSQPELDSVPGARAHATPVKPVAGLWQRWQQLHGKVVGSEAPQRVAVVGGGAGSVELAMAITHCLAGAPVTVELYCGAPQILQGYNGRARGAVMAALARLGIAVHLDARVVQVEAGALTLESGATHLFDELFWCTGAAAAPWIAASGLATDDEGFLSVSDTLQSVDDAGVFAAGDIAHQVSDPRPKAGVFAVRQAPVLAHNLRAVLLDRPLRTYRPQRRFLSLLSLGERRAVADRGPFSASGAWVWRWKDRIDREFMARFSALVPAMERPGEPLPELAGRAEQGVCGGCGAKVGADPLARVLDELSSTFPGHCAGAVDDAVPVNAPAGGVLLQSLDVLRELVRDPWTMGRIAALHALSDLYACGVQPVSALASVTLPFAHARVLERDLRQVLAGALAEFVAADCRLAGGHSMQGSEMSVGFAVSGTPMDPGGRLLTKTGAAEGDRLLLTGPLGTGTLFAAHMQLAADGRDIQGALDAMLHGNAAAARLALQHGASACTDITGFGLLGHLLEMLDGRSGARLQLDNIPLLDGALRCLREDRLSTMHPANVERAAPSVKMAPGVDGARANILYDPQTGGGLLLAVAPASAPALLAALVENGYGAAADIGEITAPGQGAPVRIV